MTDYRRPWQSKLLEQVSLALEEMRATHTSRGIVVIGESGVGKTHAFDLLSEQFAPHTVAGELVVPSFRVAVSAATDVHSYLESCLEQLGRPSGGLPHAKLFRTFLKAMEKKKAELGMLEETHNAILKSSSAIGKGMTELLKNLWNFHEPTISTNWTRPARGDKSRKAVVLVVSGTPELEGPLFSNDELSSRFGTVVRAPTPALFPDEARMDFQQLVKQMRDRHGLPRDVSPNDVALLARVFFATSGHLRKLDFLFVRASGLRALNPQLSLLPMLAQAYDSVIAPARSEGQGNPFLWSKEDLEARVNSEALRARATKARP
jgi:hypothetical protein